MSKKADILERLRNYIPGENNDAVADRIAEAADEIERLQEDLMRGLAAGGGQQILHLTAPSDIEGRPIERDGPIGLYHIRFNLSEWQAPGDLAENSIAMVEGYELVIRRTGRNIGIFRRYVRNRNITNAV